MPSLPPPKLKKAKRIQQPKRLDDWRAILKQARYPTDILLLDFETYFDEEYTLRGRKMSTIEYIMDDRFEALGLAVWRSDLPEGDRLTFLRGEDMVESYLACLRKTCWDTLKRFTVVGQNMKFDCAVLAYRYGIYPAHIIDTMGLANHWNPRRRTGVKFLAKEHKLEVQKGDTNRFKGWTERRRTFVKKSRKKGPAIPRTRPRMNDERWDELEEYALDDVRIERELFNIYLPRLSRPDVELRVMQHTTELFTKPTLMIDYDRASKLREKMEKQIEQTIADVAEAYECDITREDLSGTNSFEDLLSEALEAAGDTPRRYGKPTKQKGKDWIFAIAKDDPEREELLNHKDERVRLLMEARLAIKSWPLHISRIERMVAQSQVTDGYLPVPLKYCGAHTGRWSGDEFINLQNLGSRGHELVNAIREILIPPPGLKMVISDASQIEPRVLAWVAGQDDLLKRFANGEDTYCPFAEEVLGYKVWKPRKEDPPEVQKKMKWARNSVGKVGILGGGYGMGPDKAVGYAKGAIDLETAQRLIATYRKRNDKIVQFWHDIEKAFKYVAKYHKPIEMKCGLRLYSTPDCDVIIQLQNGRELKYPRVRIKTSGNWEEVAVYNELFKAWGHVWGGHLTENVVQALSRDILWEAIARIEANGYHVPLHVHDEVIVLCKESEAEHVLDMSIKELSVRPEWAKTCPLAAEGVIKDRYGDH